MADRDGTPHGEQSGLPGHSVLSKESKGENIVSSSTRMETESERNSEDLGTESLPQTYRASPPMVPGTSHVGAENLPQTGITTVYATMAQTSYGDSDVPMTYAVAAQRSYLGTNIHTPDTVPEQIVYVSGSVPLDSVSSTVMSQADYIITSQSVDFRKSTVSRGSEVSGMNTADNSDTGRSTVPLIASTSTVNIPLTSNVTRVSVPHIENLSRMRLPQTADVGRISISSDDIQTGIFSTDTVGRMSAPVTEVNRMNVLETNEINTVNVPVSVDVSRINKPISGNSSAIAPEIGKTNRRNLSITDDSNRRKLPVTVTRASSHDTDNVSGINMPSISRINASRTVDVGRMHTHEAGKVSWINIPITGHSVPFSDSVSKMDTAEIDEISKMNVAVTSHISIGNTPETTEAAGISANDTENVRTIGMSQMDEYSRMSVPSSVGVINTTQSDGGSHMDITIPQTAGMHVMDIKYSDLMAKSSVVDVSRISSLQAHGGYGGDEDRLNTSHLQESSEMSDHHTVDTKPIILPQTGDASIVAFPHAGEGVGAMTVPQSGNISMVILPQTVDVGQVSAAQSDVRRMDFLPVGESTTTGIQTADGSRMSIHQNGNVIRISLPVPSDLSRLNLPHTESSLLQIQQADVGRMILPQTSDVQSIEVEQKVDISKMIAQQSRDISAVEVQQKSDLNRMIPYQTGDIPNIRDPKSNDTNLVERQQLYDASRTAINQTGDTGAVERQQMYGVARTTVSHTSGVGAVDRQIYDVARTSVSLASDVSTVDMHICDDQIIRVSHAGDIGPANRQQMFGVARTDVSLSSDISAVDRQQLYDDPRINVSHATNLSAVERQMYDIAKRNLSQAGDVGAVDRQQMYNIAKTRITQAGGLGGVDRQEIYDDVRTDLSQAVETAGSDRMNVPTKGEVGMMVQQANAVKMSAAQYTDPNMMTLPQTSGVSAVSVPPCTEEAVVTDSPRQSVTFDHNRMSGSEQPQSEFIKMRMMAEAAEMISRPSAPADINMRLIAETADFVSRNVPQSSVITTTGSIQQAQDISTKIVSGTGESSTMRASQNDVTAEVVSDSHNDVEHFAQRGHVRLGSKNKTAIPASRNVQTDNVGSTTKTRTSLGKAVTAASLNQKTLQRGKERAGVKNDKGKQTDLEKVDLGFWIQFLKHQSYVRWKDIGTSQGLHTDEEIACFLIKYYDSTSALFPSGSSNCSTCQRQLKVSCIHCSQKTAGDKKDAGKDSKKEKKAGDDQTKLWKLIIEAGPNEKGNEKAKEDKPEKRHRRKPRQTRRVLRRRVIPSPSRSSDENSQEEQDTGTFADESPLVPTKVHVEEEQKKDTPPPVVTRKRGRPSNDSYNQASTLECSSCQRKFHTAAGLDQHVKRKRCKASKTGASVSAEVEPGKKSEKIITSSPFQFKCTDCSKEYRSKQGLMLHRISKHGEVNEKLQSELSEADNGDDTDDYVPYQKDKTRSVFECPDCHKEYRSKQGMLMHKASKHGPEPEKKIKLEKEGENKVSSDETENLEDSTEKEVVSFECKECNKKYASRPGYVLHMRTKHCPQVFLECPECKGKFKTKVELRIHIRRDHSKGRLILFCPYCPKTFNNRGVLRGHMDENHKTCRRVLFDCFACDLQFSSRIERKRHIQSEHKGKDTSLTCHYCGSWFATRYEYDQHEKEGHPEQTQEWLCAICGDAFPTRYLLQRHALCHKEKVHCELCNKYITEPCFEDHMKRHYGNKTWKCELCPKSFIRKAELQQHTLVHKDERPFCCELCGMRYREKSRLNSHMRTHTGVKPYKCHQCEKSFTRSRELKNHMRVHTGEKPFSCTVCGRKFASSGNLSAHRRKVHKLEPIPHGQQSRKHTLEESIKPENKLPLPAVVVPPTSHENPMAAHSNSASLEIPVAHAGTSHEIPVDHNAVSLEAPIAHSSSLTLQAPMAHQAPVTHQDQAVYQQHMIPKYEPLVTQPEHYIPQPVIQQPQSSLPIYWPNASYGEES